MRATAATAAWLAAVRRIRPVSVQVTTVDRGTSEAGVLPVSAARLEESYRAVATKTLVKRLDADIAARRDDGNL